MCNPFVAEQKFSGLEEIFAAPEEIFPGDSGPERIFSSAARRRTSLAQKKIWRSGVWTNDVPLFNSYESNIFELLQI